MKKFICLECGGNLNLSEDLKVGKCPYCLTQWILKEPLNDENFFKFQIATEYLKTYRFSDAKRNFEEVAKSNPEFYEAWWGAFLADYGIEFGINRIGEKVPTCHRANFQSVYENPYYLNSIKYADKNNKYRYIQIVEQIEITRKSILEQVNDGETYDIFICFKANEIDFPNRRTIDYEFGSNIYEYLTQNGFKVFFSPKTLLRVQEQNFEPYIFRALSTAKVMLLLCSDNKKIESAWVKNEWGRYLDMYNGNGLVPICGNRLEPYSPANLPYELQRLNAITFDENVLENIKTKVNSFFKDRIDLEKQRLDNEKHLAIIEENERIKKELEEIKRNLKNIEPNQNIKVVNSNYDVNGAIKQGYSLLEQKAYEKAIDLMNNSLLFDSQNGNFYLIRFLAKNKAKDLQILNEFLSFYENDEDFVNALKFADKSLKSEIFKIEEDIVNQVINSQKAFLENSKIKDNKLLSFKNNDNNFSNVIMCDGITSIGERAFDQALANTQTKTLTISKNVKSIEKLAFAGNNIESIYIPQNVQDMKTESFYANTNSSATLYFETPKNKMKNIYLAESGSFSVNGYKSSLHYNYKACYDFKPIIFERLDFIFENFEDLKNFYENEKLKIQEILDSKNKEQREYEEVQLKKEFEQSLIEIPKIFELRKIFKQNAVVENGVLIDYLVDSNEDFVNIYMTDDILSINPNIFSCYKKLKVHLSNSITYLKRKTFSNCINLEVYVPSSITNAEAEAFAVYRIKDAKEMKINFENYVPSGFKKDWCHIGSCVKDIPKIIKTFYNRNDENYWKNVNPKLYEEYLEKEKDFINEQKQKKLEEEKRLKLIEEEKQKQLITLKNQGFIIQEKSLIQYNGKQDNIIVPDFIEIIENGAFKDCTYLKHITIPPSVIEIESNAFKNCKSLINIDIPDSVKFIDSFAFSGCKNLTTIKLSKQISVLENGVFENCKNLKKINLEFINCIYDKAFEGCICLEKMVFEQMPHKLGKRIFWQCNKNLMVIFKGKKSYANNWNSDWNVIDTGFLGIPIKIKERYE